jgi:hypothetical protein
VVVDAARSEQIGDRLAECGGRDGHRRVLGREQVELHVAADSAPADERLREEGGLVRCGGALERHRRDEDPDDALTEVLKRSVDSRAPLRGVEVEGHLVETRHCFGCEQGSERHDQRVVAELAGCRDDNSVV